MQKILTLIIVFGICLIIIASIGLYALKHVRGQLDVESKAYVDTVVPLITSTWNTSALISRASPEFLYFNPPEKIMSWFSMFSRRLGPMKEYKGCRGETSVDYFSTVGKVTTAVYVASVVCERAPATIQVAMIRRNNRWQILEFRLNSHVFMH